MSDLISFILTEEKKMIKEEINDKEVAVIFDGTSRLGEAAVIVLHFIDPDIWSPQQDSYAFSSLLRPCVARRLLVKLLPSYQQSSAFHKGSCWQQ